MFLRSSGISERVKEESLFLMTNLLCDKVGLPLEIIKEGIESIASIMSNI